MYRRNIEDRLRAALTDTPVVLLNGARQAGKSTLVQQLTKEMKGRYITLDDATFLAAAVSDPTAFIQGMDGMTVIDEVQKAPDLFPAIKRQVDVDRRPGRFLLTGSANVLMLPRLSESLAGRMEITTLWPLSQDELLGRRGRFVDALFSHDMPRVAKTKMSRVDVAERVLAGGYPEVLARKEAQRRQGWFGSYITTILQRDVRDLAHIEGLTDMPRLLALLAARSSGLLNMSELSRSSGIAHTTLRRYLSLLETTFILQLLPAWSTNLSKRLVKSPKVHLLDSGLSSHLTGQTDSIQIRDSAIFGNLLETFVVMELRKQSGWNETSASLFHFRTSNGREVDIVLEDSRGRIVGIEVKAAATVQKKDFAGLEALAEAARKKFLSGIVLYTGEAAVSFGPNYWAIPVGAVWETM